VSFACGDQDFGIAIMAAREIGSWSPATQRPGYDPAALVGGATLGAGSDQVVLVAALNGTHVGIIADTVSDISFAKPEDRGPVPASGGGLHAGHAAGPAHSPSSTSRPCCPPISTDGTILTVPSNPARRRVRRLDNCPLSGTVRSKELPMTVVRCHNVNVLSTSGRPIIFAHGFGCDQGIWRYVAPAFTSSHKVVLFDHIGHGKSDFSAFDPKAYDSLSRYAQDILAIIGEMDLDDCILVGHSVSAMLSILAAIQEPARFSKLVLVAPSPRFLNDAEYFGGFEKETLDELMDLLDLNLFDWAATVAPLIMGNLDRRHLADELRDSICRSDPAAARHFARLTFYSDHRSDLTRLKTPSLILQCADDVIAPPSVGRYVHEQLRCSQLVMMSATGHCPHLSAPAETISAVRKYIEA
jgi:sigma-B regulation protein RsbQ